MKKTLATILTLTLLLMSCAFAEQVPAINWSDAESAAADISDVKCQAAESDQRRQQISEAAQKVIGHVLTALPGNTQNTPDIHLGDRGHKERNKDDEAEARSKAARKCRGLRKETGSDRRSGHQECSTQQRSAFLFVFHGKLPPFH